MRMQPWHAEFLEPAVLHSLSVEVRLLSGALLFLGRTCGWQGALTCSMRACGCSACNGHQCVLTTMDMNMYCDFQSSQSQDPWLELLRERIRESSVSAYNSPEFTRLRENLFATIAAVLATASGWFAP